MPLWKQLLLLILPGGLLMGVACYVHFWAAIPPTVETILALSPPIVGVVGLLLGWRFNRTRVIWVIVLLGLVWLAMQNLSAFGREFTLAVAPVLLPVNLLLLGGLSERGMITAHGLLRMALFAVQAGGLVLLYQFYAGELMAMLAQPIVRFPWAASLVVSQAAIVVFLCCLFGLLARFFTKPEALAASFCWVLGAVALGFWRPDDFAFWSGVAGVMLVAALVESSFSMAFSDELTGLPARRAMNEYLLKIGRRYTIAMVDIDHFKKVNDTFGHDVGDQVLRMVAARLNSVSGGGRAFRYGGEEFAVIFAGKGMEQTMQHLETLREAIASSAFVLRGRNRPKNKPDKPKRPAKNKNLQVTASIGVAENSDKYDSPEEVIKAADQALYKAKQGGRNRVSRN